MERGRKGVRGSSGRGVWCVRLSCEVVDEKQIASRERCERVEASWEAFDPLSSAVVRCASSTPENHRTTEPNQTSEAREPFRTPVSGFCRVAGPNGTWDGCMHGRQEAGGSKEEEAEDEEEAGENLGCARRRCIAGRGVLGVVKQPRSHQPNVRRTDADADDSQGIACMHTGGRSSRNKES